MNAEREELEERYPGILKEPGALHRTGSSSTSDAFAFPQLVSGVCSRKVSRSDALTPSPMRAPNMLFDYALLG